MTSQVTHICEHCNTPHQVYKSELKRGRGLFCSLSCARRHAHSKPDPATCLTCGATFFTRLGRVYCCVEHTPLTTPSSTSPRAEAEENHHE